MGETLYILHRWREKLEALAHRLEIYRVSDIKRTIGRKETDDIRFSLMDSRIDLHSNAHLSRLPRLSHLIQDQAAPSLPGTTGESSGREGAGILLEATCIGAGK